MIMKCCLANLKQFRIENPFNKYVGCNAKRYELDLV